MVHGDEVKTILNVRPGNLVDGLVLPVAEIAVHLISIQFIGAGLARRVGPHVAFENIAQGWC